MYDPPVYRYEGPPPEYYEPRRMRQRRDRAAPRPSRAPTAKQAVSEPEKVKDAPPPPGPHLLIVSVRSQKVSFYADGKLVSKSPVSTGKPSNPTPYGVFSIIQRNRHHRSNIYSGAPMPYMQRLTWSGIALHEGKLPGYPASHGCIRLPEQYASYLWRNIKMNTRVIVSREDVAPFEVAHPLLFQPTPPGPTVQAAAPELRKTFDTASPLPVRTAMASTVATEATSPDVPASAHADASTASAKPADDAKADVTGSIYPQRADIPAPILASFVQSLDAKQKKAPPKGPISVFISKKDKRLYVRQHFIPLFSAPVTFKDDQPNFGTHVFTALAKQGSDQDLRWIAVSMPPELPKPEKVKTRIELDRRGRPVEVPVKPARKAPEPIPSLGATAALDRIEIAPEVVERISGYITPGASLIVSDHGLGPETGLYTDFIVVTR